MRVRLRSRLVLAMALAALLPVLVVAVVATQAIFSSLERGLRDDADRQLSVATNLLLRQLERLGDEAAQLANSGDLPLAMRHGGRLVTLDRRIDFDAVRGARPDQLIVLTKK